MKYKTVLENAYFIVRQNDNGLYDLTIKTYMQDVCKWIIEKGSQDVENENTEKNN